MDVFYQIIKIFFSMLMVITLFAQSFLIFFPSKNLVLKIKGKVKKLEKLKKSSVKVKVFFYIIIIKYLEKFVEVSELPKEKRKGFSQLATILLTLALFWVCSIVFISFDGGILFILSFFLSIGFIIILCLDALFSRIVFLLKTKNVVDSADIVGLLENVVLVDPVDVNEISKEVGGNSFSLIFDKILHFFNKYVFGPSEYIAKIILKYIILLGSKLLFPKKDFKSYYKKFLFYILIFLSPLLVIVILPFLLLWLLLLKPTIDYLNKKFNFFAKIVKYVKGFYRKTQKLIREKPKLFFGVLAIVLILIGLLIFVPSVGLPLAGIGLLVLLIRKFLKKIGRFLLYIITFKWLRDLIKFIIKLFKLLRYIISFKRLKDFLNAIKSYIFLIKNLIVLIWNVILLFKWIFLGTIVLILTGIFIGPIVFILLLIILVPILIALLGLLYKLYQTKSISSLSSKGVDITNSFFLGNYNQVVHNEKFFQSNKSVFAEYIDKILECRFNVKKSLTNTKD